MKIVEKTRVRLVVLHKPWKLPLLLLLFALGWIYLIVDRGEALERFELVASILGAMLVFFSCYLTTKKSIVTFDKISKKVTWNRQEPFKTSRGEVGFNAIENIIKQESRDTEGVSYRIAMLMDSGEEVPLVAHYSTVESHDEIIDQIKSWLESDNVE